MKLYRNGCTILIPDDELTNRCSDGLNCKIWDKLNLTNITGEEEEEDVELVLQNKQKGNSSRYFQACFFISVCYNRVKRRGDEERETHPF